ncbi:MAG: ion channel [Cypionkella sp.]|uniref:ion channel n=1 Tax=Cypionkella sp. TaxID=2811411 RepID=UPI002ABAF1D6|nr:ion channel [Cypionkella sp.]MDZ4309831.1 ion channel [Cypionkella sp.]MDZ4395690.1 ion channel [Cypionkella sp.]
MAIRFRYMLLAFDLTTIVFLIASSFFDYGLYVKLVDALFGVIILADLVARLWLSKRPLREMLRFFNVIDVLVVISLIMPLTGEGLAFMRVVRMLRLLQSHQILKQLRNDVQFFRDRESTIKAAINLTCFIFFTTALVFETQRGINPGIQNYVDAAYFTIATLTTTGFGDVTLVGPFGKLISIAIMIFGVSLFLRLVQVVLRPAKVDYTCTHCGFSRHDRDAVHCKACGNLLAIKDEGRD